MRGTTKSGFTFEIADDALNDMELFEALVELDNGNGTAVVPVCERLLGKQKKALYNHVRNESGRVPIDAVSNEIADILAELKNGKKS